MEKRHAIEKKSGTAIHYISLLTKEGESEMIHWARKSAPVDVGTWQRDLQRVQPWRYQHVSKGLIKRRLAWRASKMQVQNQRPAGYAVLGCGRVWEGGIGKNNAKGAAVFSGLVTEFRGRASVKTAKRAQYYTYITSSVVFTFCECTARV
jgi:hypothetical protein